MAVIQTGSMGKAASRFNMTQPAVSKMIADLEHTLGVRLLDRSRRGAEATPHGLALVKRGIAVFDELRQGVQDLEFLSDPTVGEVRIGTTERIAAAIVAPVIDRLSRQYPQMTFHVVAGERAMLCRELTDRSVDLVIFRLAGPVAEEHSAEILFQDFSVVAAGETNLLTRRRKIALGELMNEPWVLGPTDSYVGSFQTDIFRACGLALPRLTVSTASSELRDELLGTGRFLTILPRFHLRLPRKHPSLRTLPVKLQNTRMPIAMITLKNRALSPIVHLFSEQVRALTKPLARTAS
jgi:DNA-binding transcriptional LysR family regulator